MTEWIRTVVETWGAAGVFLLMFLENVFPPIPSELIMPLAGYQARQADGSLLLSIVAGSLGALAGALLWYAIGRAVDEERLKAWCARNGRLLTLSPRDIDKADRWFGRHGGKAVFFGRLVPTVRTFISVPAGVARMKLSTFFVFTLAGTTLWTALLALGGYAAGGAAAVEAWVSPISNAVLILIVLAYLYRVATFRRELQG